ncbi:hypothetical protein SCB49_13835 [unidentified eubacterium SCB49]|nr:hypothetical protein SCB49_13835 [unidentified eubacterium SCB49]
MERPELYFSKDADFYNWLLENHNLHPNGVYIILYKVENKEASMRWEEAVKVALCFGWIDSTVQSLGNGKRRQLFTTRNKKSTWSALNKKHVIELEAAGLIQDAGWELINHAKKTGTWSLMDGPDNGIIPPILQAAFNENQKAFNFYNTLAPSYQKNYLRWLVTAKTEPTILKRVSEIIRLCENHIKTR